MTNSTFKLAFVVMALTLLVTPTLNASVKEVNNLLHDHYDDGSEMIQRIISEYASSEDCQLNCQRHNREALLNSFEKFRTEWVDNMINFVIKELGIDAESARYVRKNPANYKINYETFKLLDFK